MRKDPSRRLSVSPFGDRGPDTRSGLQSDVCHLHQMIDSERAVVDCAQRAVARGRRGAVDAKCRVLAFAERPLPHDAVVRTMSPGQGDLAGLAQDVDEIHDRLLLLSARVEREVDSLEIIRAEIDRLTPIDD